MNLLARLTDCCIFYQSVALPPPAAPAQTWKPKTASINTFLAITAAAASVQIHLGSALLVSSTQQLESDSGGQHFALQEAVAARVSGGDRFGNMFLNSILKIPFSQVL